MNLSIIETTESFSSFLPKLMSSSEWNQHDDKPNISQLLNTNSSALFVSCQFSRKQASSLSPLDTHYTPTGRILYIKLETQVCGRGGRAGRDWGGLREGNHTRDKAPLGEHITSFSRRLVTAHQPDRSNEAIRGSNGR